MNQFLQLINIKKTFTEEQTDTRTAAVDGISLDINKGEFFTLLGPSGCGKTTTLRIIGGFILPDSGEVSINGANITDSPPYRRPVHTVFQNYALFPHLTVEQNIAYGLRISKTPHDVIKEKVGQVISLVQLEGMAHRKPAQLSGGQQQRVSLARAIVNEPSVLLLDEPLGALDLKLRKEMQWELKRIQKSTGITFVYVTHDQEEALTMSDRIAIMDAGKVIQIGTPREIYSSPNSYFVANFIGNTNFIKINNIEMQAGAHFIQIGQHKFRFPAENIVKNSNVENLLSIRPEMISINPINEASQDYVMLHAKLISSVFVGSDTRYLFTLRDGQQVYVLVRNTSKSSLEESGDCMIGFSAADTFLF